MIKLYGTSMSRAARCLWALEELGLKYEHVPTPFQNTRTPEYLKINPNGHVPTLDDNGLIVWESMAINLYLADKYGKAPFWPSSAEHRAHAYQWSFWGMTECEPHLITILMNRMFAPPEQRNEKAAQTAVEALKAPFKVLERHLEGRDYLLGRDFTIADLNCASVLGLANFIQLDTSGTPMAQRWMQKCLAREANKRASAKP
jgi:glutathione S-transferase